MVAVFGGRRAKAVLYRATGTPFEREVPLTAQAKTPRGKAPRMLVK